MYVGFDEDKCYIQDLKKRKSWGLVVYLGHNRLGHPADQVLSALHNDFKISKSSFVPVCEVCHMAKQIRDHFSLSSHKSKDLDLAEDVYMTLIEGYNNLDKSKVCKLNKSLYRLKQVPRHWNAKLTVALVQHGFKQSKFDYSLYVKHKVDVFVALYVYVDDIVITGKLIYLTNTRPDINYVVHFLSQHMHSPLQSHFKAALRVLKYLKGSPRCGT
uniref:Ribonuclease H-like domain-containing protein n=1 Tax=Tanacetum cinerariifolium TaxID=118510 RepID=A0A6L2JN87_TANCI|nr:ribonuclease H-like domain-containing protein [Tanacetum cinerariifolium]